MPGAGSRRIDNALAHVNRISKVICIIILCLIVALILFGCVFFVGFVASAISGNTSTPLFSIIPLLLVYAISLCTLFVLNSIFKNISENNSPFNEKHARRIRYIGWLLLANAAIETIASLNAVPVLYVGNAILAYEPSGGTAPLDVYIDAESVVLALVCFCLSLIFKYGALLQTLSDDTV